MRKITGVKNGGRKVLKKQLDIKDKQLKRQIGTRGLQKLAYIHRKTIRDLKRNKLVTYSSEEVFEEIQEIIDKVILEQNNAI